MPARTAFSIDDLPANIARIFDQVQGTVANHQKNYVALYKLHTEAAKHMEPTGAGMKLIGERVFEDTFISMLSRALPIKKGASVVDRIIKFVGGYTKFINEKAMDDKRQKQAELVAQGLQDEDEEDDDTMTSRFIDRLLRFLFKGCGAKDKVIRFRVVQCVAEMVAHLGEVDDEIYTSLRKNLLERVRDKENPVRVQAAIALSKLCGSEEDPNEEPKITDIIIDVLTFDASADVRRAALLNLPIGADTLPAILSRTRDVDATVRRLVYHSVLEPHCTIEHDGGMSVGVSHPRALTIAQREQIIRNGLGDREDNVKNAAVKLVATWVDVVRVDGVKPEAVDVEADVVAFLNLFDLVENSTAEDALLSVFKARADILDALEFGDQYWASMTPEKAFLARVFVDYCVSTKDDRRLEAALPVVTALAFRIQTAYNELVAAIEKDEEDGFLRGDIQEDGEEDEAQAKKEEARLDREFVIGEMMRMSVNLDYADEIGRRKMFQLVRSMLSQEILPEGLVARGLDVLRVLSPNERDLIRVVVEVIHELRDPEEESAPNLSAAPAADDSQSTIADTPATVKTVRPSKPPQELTPEQRAQVDAIDIRCLSLCIGMLERVNGTFEENSTLEGVLADLIIPAVKRRELVLRERGLISLGLCCLIARRMALNSFQLFLGQIQTAPEVLKLRVLQVVFDVLMVHDRDFLASNNPNGERVIEFLLRVLNDEESEKVQALLCVGLSKLMLSGMIADDRVLRSLIMTYVSPATALNQELRQCLSYFFPVYCYSSSANQRRMQKSFIPLYEQLNEAYSSCDGDDDMISPAQACLMIVDWTDPQKAVAASKQVPGLKPDNSIHVDLANDIVRALFRDDLEKDDKKALCQLLGKLHIPDDVDDDKIRTLKLLMTTLRTRRPLRDTSTKNTFAKFMASMDKRFEKQLADFDEEEYRQLEYLKDLFSFLDDIAPDSDWDEDEVPVKKRGGNKRRSESVVSDITTSSIASDADSSTGRKSNGKGKAKRRRISESANESEEESATEHGTPPPEAPSRVLPRRSAAKTALAKTSKNLTIPPPSESEADEDDEDDEEAEDGGDVEETPIPNRIRRQSNQQVEALALSHSSFTDASEAEDAEEVDDLL